MKPARPKRHWTPLLPPSPSGAGDQLGEPAEVMARRLLHQPASRGEKRQQAERLRQQRRADLEGRYGPPSLLPGGNERAVPHPHARDDDDRLVLKKDPSIKIIYQLKSISIIIRSAFVLF